MFKILAIIFLLISLSSAYAQIGQPQVFDFLNLSPSARMTALGGMQVVSSADSSAKSSPFTWLMNPATNLSSNHKLLSLSYQPYYADIHFATLAYSQKTGERGSWGLGIQFLSYGEIESYDQSGRPTGTFTSQEYALVFNRSHQVGPFRMGINARYVASDVAGYEAEALLFDFGGVFLHPNNDLSIGISFNNLGLLLNDYTSFRQSQPPTDLRLGLTFKPQYMPFRFYLAGYYLFNQRDAYFSADNNEMPGYVIKILRHLSLGSELILGPNFSFLMGYNYLKGNTLQLEQTRGGAGLSFGISLRLRMMQLDISRSFFHAAGGINHITLSADLDRFIFKRN
jgi:hypothetical protein